MELRFVLLALLAGAVAGFGLGRARVATLAAERAALRAERDTLRAERDGARAEHDQVQAALSAAIAERAGAEARLDAEQRAAAERIALLERNEWQLKESFQALAGQAIEANGKQFLEMARDTLKAATTEARGDLDQRRQAVEHLVTPVRDALTKVETQLREIELAREGAYRGLLAQIGEMRQTSATLQKETEALVTALRKPQVRGRWGEIQLRRAVELAGMVNHCDFTEQVTTTTDDGVIRPDLVVRLTGGKCIVVDAKVTLAAYLDAIEAPDEETRSARLRDHARQLRTHVDALAAKSYWERFEQTPEYVVLFVPGDAPLAAALDKDPDLYEYAASRHVLVTTPTTIIGLLKTVAFTWRQEALADNARQVCEVGRELYKRLSDMGGHVEKLGRSLHRAVASYNDTVGSLERRVLPQARKFRDLQVIDAPLPELPELTEDAPKPLTATELVESADRARELVMLPAEAPAAVDAEMRRAAGLA